MTYPELRFWPESEFRYSWPETQFIAESLFWGFCWFENRELDVRQKSQSRNRPARTDWPVQAAVAKEMKCPAAQACGNRLNQDGSAWHDVTGGYDCAAGFGADSATLCANYGLDGDEYGLIGDQACCLCGGGSCVDLPQSSFTRANLVQAYATMSGADWIANTNWLSHL